MGTSGALRSVDPNRCGVSSAHRALLYGSEQEFLAGTVGFIRDGLECGDPVRIVTTQRNTAWLQAALGTDARQVAFGDTGQWCGHPVRALAALHRAVQAASRDGHRLRMVGERLWTARAAQERMEWSRHESLVNAVLRSGDAALVCSYDTQVVDPDVVANVGRTHPELVVNGESRPSPGYTDPVVFNAEFNRFPLPELGPPVLWLRFRRLDQLAILRSFVTSHATDAGAVTPSVGQFVQAVDEVATNAVEHGGGSGVLQIWTGPQTIVCEVSDTGTGLLDPLAGRLPPDNCTAHGHGLWLARQFSDLLEVHSDSAGTTIRLHLNLH